MDMPRCRFTHEFKLNALHLALHEKRPAYRAADKLDTPRKILCG